MGIFNSLHQTGHEESTSQFLLHSARRTLCPNELYILWTNNNQNFGGTREDTNNLWFPSKKGADVFFCFWGLVPHEILVFRLRVFLDFSHTELDVGGSCSRLSYQSNPTCIPTVESSLHAWHTSLYICVTAIVAILKILAFDQKPHFYDKQCCTVRHSAKI